jgi:hypothetical protein
MLQLTRKRKARAAHRATATLELGVGGLRLEEAVTPREVRQPAPLLISVAPARSSTQLRHRAASIS